MKKNVSGSSIVEAIVVLLIVILGITWVYSLLDSSQNIASATWKRIEAIQIARDGLESFTNIRNTNWIRFAYDMDNCWNTLNHNDNSCVWDTTTDFDLKHELDEWFILYKDNNNFFRVDSRDNSWGGYADDTYRDNFAVMKHATEWLYTQSWGTLYWAAWTPFYTREMKLDYLDDSLTSLWPLASNNQRVRVTSIVGWMDSAQNIPKSLEMSVILTNWEARR